MKKEIHLTDREVMTACQRVGKYFANLNPDERIRMSTCTECVAGHIGAAELGIHPSTAYDGDHADEMAIFDKGLATLIDIFGVERFRSPDAGNPNGRMEDDTRLVNRLAAYLTREKGIGHWGSVFASIAGTTLGYYFPHRLNHCGDDGGRWNCTAEEMVAFWADAARKMRQSDRSKPAPA